MFVSSRKGKILLYNGYRYRKDRSHSSSTSWRCCKSDCRGRLLTTETAKTIRTEHNHAPDPANNEVFVARAKMKELATTREDAPRSIILASTSTISSEAAVQLPSYAASRRAIQRTRDKVYRQKYSFQNASEIILEDRHKNTNNGEPFLLWDSGKEEHRIFMFGTRNNIALLKEFNNWCVDGTFKVAPHHFSQLYTIHALVDNRALPMIYAVTTNKQESTYKRILQKILEYEPTLKPQSVLCDFEVSSINALKDVFPDVTVAGCSFHLAQNLWRKIQKHNLTELYRDSADIRVRCKMLLALSYVPERDVQFAFEILSEHFPEQLRPILQYWEATYVGRRILNIPPRFPINMWVMFDRLRSHLPRTNNSLEAWHNSFQRTLDCHHPSIFKLIDRLKKEQQHMMHTVTRYRAGFRASTDSHSRYALRTRRLLILTGDYSFRNVLQYLEAVALNLTL